MLKVDPGLEKQQIESLKNLKKSRDNDKVNKTLANLKKAAEGKENIVVKVIEAVEAYATVGEVSDVFRQVWGEYHEQ